MWCTTECWNCEDKTCDSYRSKQDLYWENKDLKKNWEELKRWLVEYRTDVDNPYYYEDGLVDCIDDVLAKMEDIERLNDKSNDTERLEDNND